MSIPPGLPAIQKKLLIVIGSDNYNETDPYPMQMPRDKGRVLVADLEQPPGKKAQFEAHQITDLETNDGWFGKIYIPNIASNQEIYTFHPDRVIRRRLMQYATFVHAHGHAQRAAQVRHIVGCANRFRDLTQAIHEPAILTFAERCSVRPATVCGLLEKPIPTNDQEHVELLLLLCQSL